MKRFARVIVFLIAVAAAFVYWNRTNQPATYVEPDVWVGDEESGCMYPVSAITDGKNPVWWSESRRRWNQFESKQAAIDAGYRECP